MSPLPRDRVLRGDCIEVMRSLPAASVDFVLTDPPYLVDYRSRDGERIANDNNDSWVRPAFAEVQRVLRPDTLCVSFYGWNRVDAFMAAWRAAGLRPVGHLVFAKGYASSSRYLRHEHEQAFVLAKGKPQPPARPLPDVLGWNYTGNRLHPTQKPTSELTRVIDALCPAGGLVLDPFCGSGSTLVAARDTGRPYLGIEIDGRHHETASRRLLRW